MTRKQRRLSMIATAGSILAIAAGLVLFALTDRIVFFNSPSDVVQGEAAPGERIRLGGLVEDGSVVRTEGSVITFRITDTGNSVNVVFDGILPDLFREGQGVVTEGSLGADGVFVADIVLAKHDETYMPKEVADALKEQGVWQGDDAPVTN